jgi:hypothetical protein
MALFRAKARCQSLRVKLSLRGRSLHSSNNKYMRHYPLLPIKTRQTISLIIGLLMIAGVVANCYLNEIQRDRFPVIESQTMDTLCSRKPTNISPDAQFLYLQDREKVIDPKKATPGFSLVNLSCFENSGEIAPCTVDFSSARVWRLAGWGPNSVSFQSEANAWATYALFMRDATFRAVYISGVKPDSAISGQAQTASAGQTPSGSVLNRESPSKINAFTVEHLFAKCKK